MSDRLASRACAILRSHMTERLRSAVAHSDFEQARNYEALREEATVLKIAGILADAGNLDEFERVCREEGDGENRIIKAALAMARRWQSNSPISGDPVGDGRGRVANMSDRGTAAPVMIGAQVPTQAPVRSPLGACPPVAERAANSKESAA